MEKDTPPVDKSDQSEALPQEQLRQIVKNIATLEGGSDPYIDMSGIARIDKDTFLVAQIINLAKAFDRDVSMIMPDHVFELSVYGRIGLAVEVVSISDGTEGVLLAYSHTGTVYLREDEANAYILDFKNRYNLD